MFLKQSSWQCNSLPLECSQAMGCFSVRGVLWSKVHNSSRREPSSLDIASESHGCYVPVKKTAHFFCWYLLGHDTPKQRTFPRAKIVIRTYMFSLWMRHNISPKNQKIRSWSWHCKDFWALFGSASTCKRMRKPQPDKRTDETMSMTRRKANLVKHGDLPPKTGKSLDFEVT